MTAQLYFTHCLPADSVEMRGGYCVRATSTADPALLRFAASYPPHELPLEMWSSNPAASDAPRRLALGAAPGGRALVHSAHLAEDTRGCKNSFFSHYLLLPAVTPLEALRTWASPDWALSYPPGASKELSTMPLPRPGPLNDRVVTAFLSPTAPSNEQALATALCPARLAPDARKRQELLRLTLAGYLLAQQAGDAAPRGRFYILAEPGLVALLLYATIRLLPEALTADLTFSTYENAHRALRTHRARVVGTYTGSTQKGLEPDCFTTRGYALDTFNDKASPELSSEPPAALSDLVGLAARGDWQTVEDTYRLLGASASLANFAEGRAVRDAERRLKAGQAQPADLILLRRSSYGRPLLGQYQQIAWPLIRDGSLTNAELRKEFSDVLLRGLAQLKDRAAAALGREAWPEWRQYWGLIRSALKEDVTKLRPAFVEIVTAGGAGALALRLALLKDWLDLGPAELPAVLCQGVPTQALLQDYFTQHVEPNEVRPETVEPFVAVFHGLCPGGQDYAQQRGRVLAWLDVVEACRDEARRARFQHYYLQRHVPAKFRRQLTEEHATRFLAEATQGPAHVTILAPAKAEEVGPANDRAGATRPDAPSRGSRTIERLVWAVFLLLVGSALGAVGGFLLRSSTANRAADNAAMALAAHKTRVSEEKEDLEKKLKQKQADLEKANKTAAKTKDELDETTDAHAKTSKEVKSLRAKFAEATKGAGRELEKVRKELANAQKAAAALRAEKDQRDKVAKEEARVHRAQVKLMNRWHSNYKEWTPALTYDLIALCKIEKGDKAALKDITAPLSATLHPRRNDLAVELASALFAFQARYAPEGDELRPLRGAALAQARNALADVFDKDRNKELITALEAASTVMPDNKVQKQTWENMLKAIRQLSRNLRDT